MKYRNKIIPNSTMTVVSAPVTNWVALFLVLHCLYPPLTMIQNKLSEIMKFVVEWSNLEAADPGISIYNINILHNYDTR